MIRYPGGAIPCAFQAMLTVHRTWGCLVAKKGGAKSIQLAPFQPLRLPSPLQGISLVDNTVKQAMIWR